MAALRDTTRKFSARRFAVGAMVCPACRHRLEEVADRCPRCGFTGADCVLRFPFAAPALDELIDAAGLLDAAGHKDLKTRIARLRRPETSPADDSIRACIRAINLPR